MPALLRKTLSDDRGKEPAQYERLAIRVFFADPYSLWQRGTNENTTGLLRQCLPKGSGLLGESQPRAQYHRLSPEPTPTNMSHRRHASGSPCAPAPAFTRCTWNVKSH